MTRTDADRRRRLWLRERLKEQFAVNSQSDMAMDSIWRERQKNTQTMKRVIFIKKCQQLYFAGSKN
jgi:hypothetical protein